MLAIVWRMFKMFTDISLFYAIFTKFAEMFTDFLHKNPRIKKMNRILLNN